MEQIPFVRWPSAAPHSPRKSPSLSHRPSLSYASTAARLSIPGNSSSSRGGSPSLHYRQGTTAVAAAAAAAAAASSEPLQLSPRLQERAGSVSPQLRLGSVTLEMAAARLAQDGDILEWPRATKTFVHGSSGSGGGSHSPYTSLAVAPPSPGTTTAAVLADRVLTGGGAARSAPAVKVRAMSVTLASVPSGGAGSPLNAGILLSRRSSNDTHPPARTASGPLPSPPASPSLAAVSAPPARVRVVLPRLPLGQV